MDQDIIDKLPPDVQKEYMKMAIKLSEKEKQSKKLQVVGKKGNVINLNFGSTTKGSA